MNSVSDITLHGTWIKQKSSESGYFLIWGEQKFPEVLTKPRGRRPKILRHPYAASPEDMRETLHTLSESLMLDEYEPDISESLGQVVTVHIAIDATADSIIEYTLDGVKYHSFLNGEVLKADSAIERQITLRFENK